MIAQRHGCGNVDGRRGPGERIEVARIQFADFTGAVGVDGVTVIGPNDRGLMAG